MTYDTNIWYHGSASGDLRGGITGLHLGTYKAAKEALEARIGIPVEGEWDGTREYGKTLLCGKNTLKKRNIFPTGFNSDVNQRGPEEDFYPTKTPKNTSYLNLTMKPSIKAYKIFCPMTNTPQNPYTDEKANQYMYRALKRGNVKKGYYYKNDSEDYGSVSAVVPNGNCIKEINNIRLSEIKSVIKELLDEALDDFTGISSKDPGLSKFFWLDPSGNFIRVTKQGHRTWAEKYLLGFPDKLKAMRLQDPQNILYKMSWIKVSIYNYENDPELVIEHDPLISVNQPQQLALNRFIHEFNINPENKNKINGVRDDTLKKNVLLEWHEHAKLEAFYDPNKRNFVFFRNGLPAGEIRRIDPNGYIIGFAVQRSLQGTGLGKAMLHYAFEKTGLEYFTLDTFSANAFYHKIGGVRQKKERRFGGDNRITRFKIDKDKLKPSPFKFQDMNIRPTQANWRFYIKPKRQFAYWPSINENIEMLDERMTFGDLYDDTDDERIFKSELPGMRVRPLQISTNNDRDMWRFDYNYTSNEKSEWERYHEKVGHKGHIYFFKEDIEPDDNLEDLECMVDCDCRDFKYRFAYVNAQQDASFIGGQSLNKAISAPPIKTNPTRETKLCKHLAALRKYLVTNIERAMRQAPFRRRPFRITEAMDNLANKGKFTVGFYDKK